MQMRSGNVPWCHIQTSQKHRQKLIDSCEWDIFKCSSDTFDDEMTQLWTKYGEREDYQVTNSNHREKTQSKRIHRGTDNESDSKKQQWKYQHRTYQQINKNIVIHQTWNIHNGPKRPHLFIAHVYAFALMLKNHKTRGPAKCQLWTMKKNLSTNDQKAPAPSCQNKLHICHTTQNKIDSHAHCAWLLCRRQHPATAARSPCDLE